MSTKTYLGDGVYARHEDDAILLTTEDEDGETVYNEIFLDQPTAAAFLEFTRREKQGRWTTDAPTEPGWYWFAPSGEGTFQVVQVWKSGDVLLSSDQNATYAPAEMDGTWYSEALTVPGPNGGRA